MAASATSKYVAMTPVSISSEVFDVFLDNNTNVDITPTQIKAIQNITITPLNTNAFTNFGVLIVTQFGNSGLPFLIGQPKVRIVAAGAVFTAAEFLVTLYGTTA